VHATSTPTTVLICESGAHSPPQPAHEGFARLLGKEVIRSTLFLLMASHLYSDLGPPRVQAQRARTEVRDQKRTTQHRHVLHEHDQMHLGHHGVMHRPEFVHHQGDRNQEKRNQAGPDLGAIPQQNAQASRQRENAREWNQDRGELDHALTPAHCRCSDDSELAETELAEIIPQAVHSQPRTSDFPHGRVSRQSGPTPV